MADAETTIFRPGGRLNHSLVRAASYWHSLLTQAFIEFDGNFFLCTSKPNKMHTRGFKGMKEEIDFFQQKA